MARAQTPARQLGIGGPHPLADDALPWLAIEVARVLRAHMPQAATRTLTLTLTLTPTRTLTRTRTLTLTLTRSRMGKLNSITEQLRGKDCKVPPRSP